MPTRPKGVRYDGQTRKLGRLFTIASRPSEGQSWNCEGGASGIVVVWVLLMCVMDRSDDGTMKTLLWAV